jgi:hypothetical protein
VEAVCRVQWDAQLFDWVAHSHPTGSQCFQLFNWVLDVTEFGPPPDPVRAAEPGVLVRTLEDARLNIFYVEWPDRSTIAVVQFLSW